MTFSSIYTDNPREKHDVDINERKNYRFNIGVKSSKNFL